jgi:hypothetical protein
MVVSGATASGPVATANGDRLSTWPQTCAVAASTEVVTSIQALPFQWSRRTGSATEAGS